MESRSQPAETSARTSADEDDDFTYLPASAIEPAPEQVSSVIAIIRIVSVLAMGLFVSFGLFIMLVGLKGVLLGVPLVLMAIPCYYGMQYAEKLAKRAESRAAESHDAEA